MENTGKRGMRDNIGKYRRNTGKTGYEWKIQEKGECVKIQENTGETQGKQGIAWKGTRKYWRTQGKQGYEWKIQEKGECLKIQESTGEPQGKQGIAWKRTRKYCRTQGKQGYECKIQGKKGMRENTGNYRRNTRNST